MELQGGVVTQKNMKIAMYWIVVILAVIVDQTTKAAAREVLDASARVIVPGVINLVRVENTGAAFSLGEGATILFIVIALAFVIAATLFVWREDDLPNGLVVSVGLVAGGGFGNMIDRVIDGSVTDFISFGFIDFPVFNVADICVTTGVVLSLIWFWIWDSKRTALADADGSGNE